MTERILLIIPLIEGVVVSMLRMLSHEDGIKLSPFTGLRSIKIYSSRIIFETKLELLLKSLKTNVLEEN